MHSAQTQTHHNRLHQHSVRRVRLHHQSPEWLFQLDDHSQTGLRHIIVGLQLHLHRTPLLLHPQAQVQHRIQAGLCDLDPGAGAWLGPTERRAGGKLWGTVGLEGHTAITATARGLCLIARLDTEQQPGVVGLQVDGAVQGRGVEDCQAQGRHHPQRA